MIPHDHRDVREATASPQALVRGLHAQKGALPEALHQQCVAAGAAMVPALIALLEAGLADDEAEPERAWLHAVDLLGALGDARAVPILLRCLAHDDLFDGLALPAAAALRSLGPAALEGCLAAYATTPNAAFRDRLAGVLSRCGVHDERIYACLVETLRRTPELGANYLAEYGEARALDVLAHAFDTLPLRDEESPLANHVFIELRAAIEDLGGQLTAAQTQKFEAADAARRRFVAQMSWDADPAAASAWRTPLEAASVAGARPPTPSRARKLGRNAPCWCGSGQRCQRGMWRGTGRMRPQAVHRTAGGRSRKGWDILGTPGQGVNKRTSSANVLPRPKSLPDVSYGNLRGKWLKDLPVSKGPSTPCRGRPGIIISAALGSTFRITRKIRDGRI
jgi:hypothetical protein